MRDLNTPLENTRFQRWTVVCGILLLGFNLRTVAISVGPVLAEVTQGRGMGEVATGLLTALPVIAFAVFGALAVGVTSASVFTVPRSEHMGSWRGGLAFWAGTAAVAAVPWVLLLRHDAALWSRRRSVSLGQVARTRLGWAMALLFRLQAAQAYTIFGWFAQVYRDAGFSASTAGLLLGVITGLSIPLSW